MLALRQRLNRHDAPGSQVFALAFFRGLPFRIQSAIFDGSGLDDLSDVSSVTLMIKASPEDTGAALLSTTVAAADFADCEVEAWLAGTGEQLAFEFTDAETNIDLDGGTKRKLWAVFKALLSGGESLILGRGWIVAHESGSEATGDPPENPAPALGVAAADARFVRFDGEQILTTEEQDQVKANLNIEAGGVSDHGALSGLADNDHPQYALAAEVTSALAGKASSVHTHAQNDVDGLTAALVALVPTSRTVSGTKSLTGGGALSANRTLELVNDSAAPGAFKTYATDSGGSKGWVPFPWKPGVKTVTGYTTPGAPATAASLLVTVYASDSGQEAYIQISTDDGAETFYISPTDPMTGIWVDSSGLYSSFDYTVALAAAIAGSSLASVVTVDHSGGNAYFNVNRIIAGSAYYVQGSANNSTLTLDVSGGGYGTDEEPPSGGVQALTVAAGTHGIIAGYWMSSDGFTGTVELYNDSDVALWSISDPAPGAGGIMAPSNATQAALWAGTTGLHLRVTEPVPEGGSLSLVLVLF